MSLVEHITATLSPELGAYTADVVARHLCAKYAVGEGDVVDPQKLGQLREFLRRGLVMYVGAERAGQLAEAAIVSR